MKLQGEGEKRRGAGRPAWRALARAAAAVLGALAVAGAASAAPQKQQGQMFRWVDENGVVHYTDQVPPDAAKRPRAKLNPQAKILEFVEGQKTPEQLEQARRLKKLRADQQRILVEQRDSDTSLNRTYRSEEEMRVVLQGKLNTMDSAKKIADANRQHQEEILRSLIKRAAEAENSGQPVPQLLRDSIDSTRKQIALYQEKSRTLESNKADIVAGFAKDLKRLKSLQEMRQSAEFGSLEWNPQRPEADVLVVSAVSCEPAVCELAWGFAKEYIKLKTPRPLVTETPTIMQTAGPRAERDMAVLVVRIAGKAADTIFLDTSCHISSIGDELCSGETARDIRAGFVPYMEQRMKETAGLRP